jgi:hypothetical protein
MSDRIDTELERGVGARRAAAEEPIEVRRHLDALRWSARSSSGSR